MPITIQITGSQDDASPYVLPSPPGTLAEAERTANRLFELIRSDCEGKRYGVRVMNDTACIYERNISAEYLELGPLRPQDA